VPLKYWLLSARLDGVKSQHITGAKQMAYNLVAVVFAVIMYLGVK
jgi:hypothetical protein